MAKRVFLLLLAFTLLACGCQKEKHSLQESKSQEIKAKLYEVRPYTVSAYRIFPGEVCPKEKITLTARVPGYVQQILVEEGQTVSKGELLLRLDDREIKAEVKALYAQLAAIAKEREAVLARLKYAEANFKRFRALLREKAATKEEYERAKAEYLSLSAQKEALLAKEAALKAQITKVKVLLSYVELKAPAKVRVVKRLVSQGDMVTHGTPLLVLEGLKEFHFCVSLDESLISKVNPKGNYLVSFPALGKSMKLKVLAIVPAVDPQAKTFLLKLSLPEGNWPSGLLGRLYFPVVREEKLLIPRQAIFFRGDLAGVYAVDERGFARFQVVRLGKAYLKEGKTFKPAPQDQGTYQEVLSGLSPGEKIVLEPEKVHDGAKVI